MAYNHDQSNEPNATSCCEKIHNVIFGKSKRNHVPNPKPKPKTSLPTVDDYPTVKPHVSSTLPHSVPYEVKTPKHYVQFSSNYVEDNDADQKTFSEEEYSSYIDGTKMKMRAPSDASGATSVSRGDDSFNDTVSSFISRGKLKLIARPSVSDLGMTLEP